MAAPKDPEMPATSSHLEDLAKTLREIEEQLAKEAAKRAKGSN